LSLIIEANSFSKWAFFPPLYNNNLGDYRTRSLGGTANERITFRVPQDFSSLVDLYAILQPVGTVTAQDIDLTTDYALDTEAHDANSESDLSTLYTFTAGVFGKIDLTGVFSSLEKNHNCGVNIDQNSIGTTINYLGIFMGYN